jgi:hypothetical protein
MAPVNLADALLYEHLRHGCGERLAVWTAAGPLTYAQLADRVDEFAREQRRDLHCGVAGGTEDRRGRGCHLAGPAGP